MIGSWRVEEFPSRLQGKAGEGMKTIGWNGWTLRKINLYLNPSNHF